MLKVAASFAFLILIGGLCSAQKAGQSWLRVLTEDDYVIEVNKNSLTLEPSGIIGADFRTYYSQPEYVDQKSTLQYQSRLDSIEFKIAGAHYRIVESSFVDSTGKSVFKHSGEGKNWKSRNNTSSLLYSAAAQLAPFGYWKVLSYHYTSGEGPADNDPAELRELVGRTIEIRPSYLFIGNSNCPGADLDFKFVSDKDLTRYGLTLKDFGVDTTTLPVIAATCKSNRDYPPQISIFLHSSSKAKLLWGGVFFDIERPPNTFTL